MAPNYTFPTSLVRVSHFPDGKRTVFTVQPATRIQYAEPEAGQLPAVLWFDTLRARVSPIEELQEDEPDRLAFRTPDGWWMEFEPLTVGRWREWRDDKPPARSNDELVRLIDDTVLA